MKIPVRKATVVTPEVLSPKDCLAKTFNTGKGCDVTAHLLLTAYVLRALKEKYADTPKKIVFQEAAEYLAALHDIGKATPGFQQKIYRAIGTELFPNHSYVNIDHGEYSGWILRERFGEIFAELAANHHGFSRNMGNPEIFNDKHDDCGGKEWIELRQQILTGVLDKLGLQEKIPAIPKELEQEILGAVIAADWLSSSAELAWGDDPAKISAADIIEKAGFKSLQVRQNLTFEDIFGFSPNSLQKTAYRRIIPGEINVIESEMGSGKTEAALYIAYKMLEEKAACGIYFALPTQLTSEKIYTRLNEFLKNISPEMQSDKALLIHGSSYLDWNLSVSDEADKKNMSYPDSWFQTKKRALLAPFGVGTIDQALLAILNVRHNAVRAFALAGKVVIIDECHSYDHYTGFLLKKLISKLRDSHCTVIILSATLTDEARREFALLPPAEEKEADLPYPLISCNIPGKQEESRIAFEGNPARKVDMSFCKEQECLRMVLEKAAMGEQVLWLENTVQKAQEIFTLLSGSAEGMETGLIHSRFPRCIRLENENKWVELLGKNGVEKRCEKGRILVGTQVLEQSVDIDADLLITRLAPVDMILQRIGRLWRHSQLTPLRPQSASRQAVILTDERLANNGNIESGTFLPYEDYHICRTYEALKDRKTLMLPDDIRMLLESVYQEREESIAFLQFLKGNMKRKMEEFERKALLASSNFLKETDDDKASTRLNEVPTVQLLILKKNNGGRPLDEALCSPFLDAPLELNKKQHSIVAASLMNILITVPEIHAPSYESFPADFLAPFLYTGTQEFRPLRIAFMDDDGKLLDLASNPHPCSYSHIRGFLSKE